MNRYLRLLWTAMTVIALLLVHSEAEAQRKKTRTTKKEPTRERRADSKSKKKTATKNGTAKNGTAKKGKSESRSTAKKQGTTKGSSQERKSATAERPRTRQPRSEAAVGVRNRPIAVPASFKEEEPVDLARATYDGTTSIPLIGTKQQPVSRPPLDSADLQSLAPVRLHPEVVVPLRGYPLVEPPARPEKPIVAEASFGMYTTGAFRLGYSGVTWPYDYYARAEGLTSRGFIDNAGRTNLSAALGGGYIIDDGYGIFSGGHMGADFAYDMSAYRRYAVATAPERRRSGWQVAASGGNTFGSVTFDARGRYRALELTDSIGAKESSLEGSLQVSKLWQGFKIGADADARLTALSGTSIPYGNLAAYLSYSTSVFTIRAGGSAGYAENSDGSSITRLAPAAELRIYPISGVTISGGVTGGISPTTLQSLLETNPYVSVTPIIRREIEKLGYNASLRIETSRAFSVRARAARSTYDNYAYFGSPVNGVFVPRYDAATITKIDGDASLRLSATQSLIGSAIFMETKLDDGAQVPYVPKWQIAGSFSQRLRGIPLTITGTARMIGQRELPLGGTLEPVTLFDVEGTYALAGLFDIYGTFQNILDTRYQIWEGYRERGMYAAVGIRSRF